MQKAVEFSSIHHFDDDTNLLLIDKLLKKINKHINRDLKWTADWIKASKLSLNASKAEIVLSKPRNKKITKQLNFRVSGQKLKTIKSSSIFRGHSARSFALGYTSKKPWKKNSVLALVYYQKLDTMFQCTSCGQFIIHSLIPA